MKIRFYKRLTVRLDEQTRHTRVWVGGKLKYKLQQNITRDRADTYKLYDYFLEAHVLDTGKKTIREAKPIARAWIKWNHNDG